MDISQRGTKELTAGPSGAGGKEMRREPLTEEGREDEGAGGKIKRNTKGKCKAGGKKCDDKQHNKNTTESLYLSIS